MERETYSLALKDSGQIVQGSQWEQQIYSGQWLVMSALVRRSIVVGECPNCQARRPTFRLEAQSQTYESERKW